jgi:putative aldouronate transport system substrate-binding protein
MKKLFCFLLIFSVVVTLFSGCTKKESQMEENTTTSKAPNTASSTTAGTTAGSSSLISEKPITLTYWVFLHPNAAKIIQNHNESVVYQQLEKLTGIKIDFMHPPIGQHSEQFQLLISSNNLPDIIEGLPQNYPGGPDLAIQNGTYVKLNDLIDEYAPNYKRLREDPEIARDTITDQGNVYCFQQVQENKGKPWAGPFLRGDWLDDLGLEVPETIDDWYIMLKAFKESKGASAPLALAKSGFSLLNTGLNSAWGVGQEFYKVDNIVKYGPAEPMYKDFLMTMNKWYTEGLIDKDFATRDRDTYNSLLQVNPVPSLSHMVL